ncbi:MAG: T9SS type A sorting domain-containing protein [Bacteroidia bacterium]
MSAKSGVEALNAILCAGDTAQMIAHHPVPGSTFIWTPTTTLSPANSQTPNAYPTVPTWYYVTATDPINNCVSVDSALVNTGYPSTLPPLIPDTLISCNQGTIIFPLNPNFTPIGNDFYEWNLVGNITPDPNHPSSDAIINTNIYPATYHFVLQVTNEFGCITKDSVDVNVNCTVLPTAVSLRGEALPAGNLLTWHVEAGGDAQRFALERSGDGLSFAAVTQVEAKSANIARDYDHLDVAPPDGNLLYRVRITDRDGQSQYTESVLLHRESGRNMALFPNPTSGRMTIIADESLAGANLQVMNAMGQCVLKQPGMDAPSMELDLKGLAAGAYMLEIWQGAGVTHLRVVVR